MKYNLRISQHRYLIVCVQMQRRIQEELDSKVGMDRTPQLSDRGSLPYLEATIREVLRIRPVAPLLIPHVALSDTRYTQHCHETQSEPLPTIHLVHHVWNTCFMHREELSIY